MVATDVAVDRRHPKALLVDHQLAMQKSVGLRTQPRIHLRIATAAKTADSARRGCRPEGRGVGAALRSSTRVLRS